MRFLDRPQYCIWFSNRCNYACSYCINRASRDAPKSEVERHTDALVRVFRSVEPGVIMVSGGEPLLWEAMPQLLERLSQHLWVILTNLSFVPSWLHHPRIVLVIAACHYDQCDLDRFVANTRQLRRVIAKVLVQPGGVAEAYAVEVWHHLTEQGVVTHLAPVEWPRGNSEWLLDLVSGDLLTSCLYNSRFFFNDTMRDSSPCPAGTRDMFQVMPSGMFLRCSQSRGLEGMGSMLHPSWLEEPADCNKVCYCEWHHWAGVTLADDNDTWTHFVESGEWVRPSPDQFAHFLERSGYVRSVFQRGRSGPEQGKTRSSKQSLPAPAWSFRI